MDVAPASVDRALASPGRSLEPALRQDMEQRFGHDFSRVRVHTGALAEQSAQDVMARAYTVGHDIVFGAGGFAPGTQEGRRLIAHELTHVVQQSGAAGDSTGQNDSNRGGSAISRSVVERRVSARTVQRAPVPQAEIEMPAKYVFALDERKRTDKSYARSLGQKDAARIRKTGRLSPEDREEVNAKLRFFEGEASQVYEALIKPALRGVSQEEIEMPSEPARPPEPTQPAAEFAKFASHPKYIDNNIKEISFYTAELAIIHYHDGSSFELGLVRRWMKPPIEEVNYHTPREDYRPIFDQKGGVSFIRESNLRNVPRSMPWGEVQKHYAKPVSFSVQPGTGRIIPSRVNMLTAPTLCQVLHDSEKKFVEQTKWAAEWGTEVTKVTGWMGGGGFVGSTGSRVTRRVGSRQAGRMASRQAARHAVEQMTKQMDDLLKAGGSGNIHIGGVVFERVQVARQGGSLAVRRWRTQRLKAPPGHGRLMHEAFEDAAVSVARMNGLKTVTIDIGVIINRTWGKWLTSIGYVYNRAEGVWIKTINL